jgi:hypothetical protein
LWPLLGFLFMPLTTLSYAFAINSSGSIDGLYLVLVVVTVLTGYTTAPTPVRGFSALFTR